MPPIAEISDTVIGPLIQSGALGVVVLFFMWSTNKQNDRAAAREDRLIEKIDSLREAFGHLVQITGIEILSRPSVQQRMRDEVSAVMDAVGPVKRRENEHDR